MNGFKNLYLFDVISVVMRMKNPDEEMEAEKSPFDDGKWVCY